MEFERYLKSNVYHITYYPYNEKIILLFPKAVETFKVDKIAA